MLCGVYVVWYVHGVCILHMAYIVCVVYGAFCMCGVWHVLCVVYILCGMCSVYVVLGNFLACVVLAPVTVMETHSSSIPTRSLHARHLVPKSTPVPVKMGQARCPLQPLPTQCPGEETSWVSPEASLPICSTSCCIQTLAASQKPAG
jgi:hypothetical protein